MKSSASDRSNKPVVLVDMAGTDLLEWIDRVLTHRVLLLALLVLGLVSSASLVAHEDANADSNGDALYNQYRISASANGEVVNDLMAATLAVEHEDRDSAALANRVNADMAWALEQVRQFPVVESRSGNYSTWPQYSKKRDNNGPRVIGWRSRQILHLESDDFPAMRKAIKALQERLLMQGLQLRPKPETRDSREEDLIADALNAFQQRASLVQATMGANGFNVITVDINTDAHGGRPAVMHRMEMDSMASTKGVTEPAIAAGTSQVTVHVHGRIQLQ